MFTLGFAGIAWSSVPLLPIMLLLPVHSLLLSTTVATMKTTTASAAGFNDQDGDDHY